MRTVTDEYSAQVKGNARRFGFYIEVYGNSAEPDKLWLDDIISLNITRAVSDGIQIGACMSDRLTLTTRATSLFNGRLKKVRVFCRCTHPITEWHALGTFYVDSSVTEHGITTVSAYDMMGRLDKPVKWIDHSLAAAPVFPCAMQDVLDYLCARAAVTTDFKCQSFTIDSAPDGYTARELIGYIAACHGANARFSPNEILQIRPYTQTGAALERGRCYDTDVADDIFTVNGILFDCGGDTKIFIDGSGGEYDPDAEGIIECFAPFATIASAEYAWSQIGGMSCSACSAEFPAENILEVGDVITACDSLGNDVMAVITEQELSVTCDSGYIERISCSAHGKNNQRASVNRVAAVESNQGATSSGAALTEYEYISDSSVKYNGTTYSVEKNDNGLISKISDSDGNEFKPTISGDISDVTLHNAVFWGLAMHSGISRNYYDDTLTPMVQYRYNVGRYTASGADIELLNQANGADVDVIFTGATIGADRSVYVIGSPESQGSLNYTTGADVPDNTVYLVAMLGDSGFRCFHSTSKYDSYGQAGWLLGNGSFWAASSGSNNGVVASAIPKTQKAVLVLRQVDGQVHFYLNGNYIGVCPSAANAVTSGIFRFGSAEGKYFDGGGYHYYDFAFAESAHSEADVIRNSKYLMWKYGIK